MNDIFHRMSTPTDRRISNRATRDSSKPSFFPAHRSGQRKLMLKFAGELRGLIYDFVLPSPAESAREQSIDLHVRALVQVPAPASRAHMSAFLRAQMQDV